jgi:hypothetical protein
LWRLLNPLLDISRSTCQQREDTSRRSATIGLSCGVARCSDDIVPVHYLWTHRQTVPLFTVRLRSIISSSELRKLRPNGRYHRTHSTMISAYCSVHIVNAAGSETLLEDYRPT